MKIDFVSEFIGIEFGERYLYASIWKNETIVPLINKQGERRTPAHVSFTEKGYLVGDSSKIIPFSIQSKTLFEIRNLIGLSYDSPEIKEKLKNCQLEVLNKKGGLIFKSLCSKGNKYITIEEIVSELFMYLLGNLNLDKSKKNTSVVITVPFLFTYLQRSSVRTAGCLAGLNILQLLHEPKAAIIAYDSTDLIFEDKKVLVYHLDVCRLKATIIYKQDQNYEVLADSINLNISGEKIDERIADYLIYKFRSKHQELELNASQLSRVKAIIENVKYNTQFNKNATIYLEFYCDLIDFDEELSRVEFENNCEDIFYNSELCLDKVLDRACLKKNDIDFIIMVGDLTRIPKIKEMLSDFFSGKPILDTIDPCQVLSIGAAKYAYLSSKKFDKVSCPKILVNVTTKSIGIELEAGLLETIIPCKTTVPFNVSKTFTTKTTKQSEITISLYEGEEKVSITSRWLGKILINDIPRQLDDQVKFQVDFSLNVDGILNLKNSTSGLEHIENIQLHNNIKSLSS